MITLSKYQESKLRELMCPLCNGELDEWQKMTKRCMQCGMVYVAEVKRSDASH